MRYERKYRIESSTATRVYLELMCNPVSFKEAFPDRIVNSIYYDDINYSAYNDNLLGIADRVKYRVRWYGDTLDKIKSPVLEKKIKHSLLGTKEYHQMENFSLSQSAPELSKSILQISNQLFPHVIVRYRRTYLESMDGLLRATIDKELQYINLVNGKVTEQSHKDDVVILEIKYNQEHTKVANNCMQLLPYRLTKNSKYVSAMSYYLH